MPEHDDGLSAALQDYYRAMAQQPAPDVTGRVMMSADRRNARSRRWGAIGGGALAAAAVGAVVAVALVNHNQPTVAVPAHSSTPAPTATIAPPTISPSASHPPAVAGPPVQGFVPTDVTAISASEWWVLGYNGRSCTSASCTRIVHTTDGGHTFASIDVPPVAPAQGSQQSDRLRFADGSDGWLVSGTGTVWDTHDGGAQWAQDSSAGTVTDLEATKGLVYAAACVNQGCSVERSVTAQDSWSTLPASSGHGVLNRLQVHGSDVWVAIQSSGGGPGTLLASTDAGQSFAVHTACPSALGFANLYAVDNNVVWATCATGTEAAAYRSLDGGQSFTQLSGPVTLANFASIAGVSQTTAVIGAQALLRTVDGGQTFTSMENNQGQWTIVGFTTQVNGFSFDITNAAQSELWRTNDAGAHWYSVQFP